MMEVTDTFADGHMDAIIQAAASKIEVCHVWTMGRLSVVSSGLLLGGRDVVL